MSLREALEAFLEHRRDVLGRRTRHRLAHIADRLEVLDGYLAVYLTSTRLSKSSAPRMSPSPN